MAVNGRVTFRYFVENGGPGGANFLNCYWY